MPNSGHPILNRILSSTGSSLYLEYIDMIKVTQVVKQDKKINYPRLMTSRATGSIILMYDRNSGTVLEQAGCTYPVGFWSTMWDHRDLEDYTGTLTLENQ